MPPPRLRSPMPPNVPYTASPARLPPLVIASSSLALSGGLAALLYVFTRSADRDLAQDQDGVEMDEAAVVTWWAGDMGLRWALLSSAGSLAGVLGLLLRNSKLHRLFALTTAIDLLACVLFTLTLALLTFTPALSAPFSTFLCSSALTSSPSSLLGTVGRERESLRWSDGVELVLWGVETCEDNWQTGMVGVILGAVVATALRVYGTWITWEWNAEMKEQELRDVGEGWVDQEMCEIDTRRDGGCKTASAMEGTVPTGRPRSSSTASTGSSSRSGRRSTTLPLYSDYPSPLEGHKRSRSHTIAHDRRSRTQPQLVLVPVVLDSHGRPHYSPTSAAFHLPPFASPPRSRSSTYNGGTAYPPSPSPSSASSSRSPSSSRSKRPPSLRPRSSSSSSSSTAFVHSPLANSPELITFTDEPESVDNDEEEPFASPPMTPTALTTTCRGGGGSDECARRARSRSENGLVTVVAAA
ncbi:hypothetical protein JCM8097_009438 [Rhodosporidiobolus ruineniae]